MLSDQEIHAAAQRGWWVGTVIEDETPRLAVLGITRRFSAEKVLQEVVSFAHVQDELAIRILAAVMGDSTRSVA